MVEVLQRAGVPYMVTGSLVSSLQGEPRATHDIDLIVQIDTASGGNSGRKRTRRPFRIIEGVRRFTSPLKSTIGVRPRRQSNETEPTQLRRLRV